MKYHAACLAVGSCQPNDYAYPVTDGRRFQEEWFEGLMPDGTRSRRLWLSYSKRNDKAYCIPCILFSGPRASDLWTTTGYDNWRNGTRDICRHEVTEDHREAEIAQINWKRGVMVDNLIERNRKDVIQENRKVMICVLDCVRYLSEKNDGISWKDSQ